MPGFVPLHHDQEGALHRRLQAAAVFVESHGAALGCVLLCLYVLAALGEASEKFLWYDELVTVKVASLPTARAILAFFYTGRDTTSATCALLVHWALRLPISPELSARLPFIAAFACMLCFAYCFVARRYPASYGLCTGVLLFAPYWMRNFGIEARGYMLMVAGTALACFCWQTAAQKASNRFPSLLGLWFGLALAVNAHTFAILLFVPFALAELARTLPRRRVDWPVWVAISLFPLGLAPVLHGQRAAQHFYGGSFWAQPHLSLLFTPYKLLLSPPIVVLDAVLGAYLAFLVYARREHLTSESQSAPAAGFSMPEWVLVLALAALPLYALPASFLIHVYRPFYVLEYFVGLGIALTALLAELGGRSRLAGTALLAGLLVYGFGTALSPVHRGLQALAHPGRVHVELAAQFNEGAWIQLLRHSDLPIVAGEHLIYTQMAYYGTPDVTDRLTVLTDLPHLATHPQSDTGQKNLALFGPALGFHTDDASHFFAAHSHFLLTGRVDPGNWITGDLLKEQAAGQASVELLGPPNTDPDAVMWISDYDVRLRPALSAHQGR